jgi:hypothetical protein
LARFLRCKAALDGAVGSRKSGSVLWAWWRNDGGGADEAVVIDVSMSGTSEGASGVAGCCA